MYVIAIDDTPLATLGMEPALITSLSEDLAFTVRRREGAMASPFFGGSPDPAIWSILMRPPDVDARAALLALLTSRLDEERRLLAVRDDPQRTVVAARAAIYQIIRQNELDLIVEMEGIDSVWSEDAATITRKTFASAADQAVHVVVPGSTRTAPSFRLTPLAQRGVGTSEVGSRYRTRYAITNTADEPLWRYPLRIDLGSTTALVSGGKALASGNDVRLWIDGIEHPRTLVSWNTAASYLWLIVPVLLPEETLVVEVVYGNAQAGTPPVLAYPDLPPFTLASSSNASWSYPVNPIAANGALGCWYLSKATEGANADFTVPGAWRPLATLGNPDNVDAVAQLRASQYTDAGVKYQAIFDAFRSVNDSTVVLATNAFDGVGIHNPLGIVSVTCNVRFLNAGGVGALVILTRDSAAEGWERLYTNTSISVEVVIGNTTYTPGAPVKHLAFAVWPANLVGIPEATDPTYYARMRWSTNLVLALDSSKVTIAPVLTDVRPWTPLDLGGALKAWYRADAITGLSNNDAVAQWPDSSGNALHATQVTTLSRPTYKTASLNGLPGVDFSGAQSLVTGLSASALTETIAAVVNVDAIPTTALLLGASSASGRELHITTGRQLRFSRLGAATIATSTATVTLDTPAIIAATLASPNSSFAINGTTATAASAGQSAISGVTTTLGSAYDGLLYDLVAAGPLSLANTQRLEGFLAGKYGLALPGGHPYQSAAPLVGGGAETEVYELATELRLGGGATRIAPYTALLIGNARGASGAGTPRCAIGLDQTLIIDGDARTHGVWPAALTTKAEDVSAHAVRGIVGWEGDGETVEGFTSEWVPLPPNLPHMPASTFDAGLDGWALETAASGMTVALSHAATVGGDVAGALAVNVSPSAAGIGAQAIVSGPRILPTAGRESVSVAAWVMATNANLPPRLFMRFLDAERAVLAEIVEAVWAPTVNDGVRRVLAARVPERAAAWQFGVVVHAVTAGATGTVWLDDVRPNAVDLVVTDAAIGSLDVAVSCRGQWLW